jgi:hypothetical protein
VGPPTARADAPRGDPGAALPGRAEILALPETLDAADAAFRRLTAAAVLGLLARAGDERAAREWRREVADAAGLLHLRTARTRRRDRTRMGHRRALFHLREAYRAGYRVSAPAALIALVLTPQSRRAEEGDPFRH